MCDVAMGLMSLYGEQTEVKWLVSDGAALTLADELLDC